MPLVQANIVFIIDTDYIPPEIPGMDTHDGDVVPPISGAEQVVYEVFKKIQEVLPEKVHAFIHTSTLLDR